MNMMKFTASLIAVIGVAEANFRSGSVSTFEKFQYGKFVTRMKTPDRKGTVASFFTYWDGPNFSPENWNELDMEIVPSVSENPFSMNIIYGDGHDRVESHDYAHGFNPHDEWHVYEMEWTPHYISWSVDGHEMRHVALGHDPAVDHLQKAQSLRMNFWTPTFHSWGAGFNPVDMPWYVEYDYVEVYTYDIEHNEFMFHWRDDFNHFDSGKWHKAAGSFENNTSTFYPNNVYTNQGHLVLKMEPEHNHQTDLLIEDKMKESFGLDLDNRRQHDKQMRKFRGMNDAKDNHYRRHSRTEDVETAHHERDYVDHHDDYYRGRYGDYLVDHHDTKHHDQQEKWETHGPHHQERLTYTEADYQPDHHLDVYHEKHYHEPKHHRSHHSYSSDSEEAELQEYEYGHDSRHYYPQDHEFHPKKLHHYKRHHSKYSDDESDFGEDLSYDEYKQRKREHKRAKKDRK